MPDNNIPKKWNTKQRLDEYRKKAVDLLHHTNSEAIPVSLLIGYVIVTGAILCWLLWRCNFGLDFSDESNHLFKITQPSAFKTDTFLYGYIYHLFYRLFNGDLVLLRQVGMAVQFLLTWILCWEFFGVLYPSTSTTGDPVMHPATRAALAFALAITGLLSPISVVTPNYNELNKTAYLCAGIGILMANAGYSSRSLIGWALIAVAGYLAFLSKPPTAMALGMVLLAYLLISRKFNLKLQIAAIAVFGILLTVTEVAIHGSLSAAVENTMAGYNTMKTVSTSYGIKTLLFRFNTPVKLFRPKLHGLISNSFLLLMALALLWSLKSAKRNHTMLLIIFLTGIGLILDNIYFGVAARAMKWTWNIEDPLAVVTWQGLFWLVVGLVFLYGRKTITAIPKERLALLGCFVLFPYAYAFGSASNQIYLSGYVALFLILAFLLLLSSIIPPKAYWQLSFLIIALTQLLTVASSSILMEFPYRQSVPYREMHGKLDIPGSPSPVFVEQDTVDYVDAMRAHTQKNGFAKETPILNLTGYDVGILYFLGASPLGASWLVGASDETGRLKYAETVLRQESPERMANAWILSAPGAKVEIPDSLLEEFYPNWKERFQLVADIPAAPQTPISAQRHLLYKPLKEKP